MKWYFACNENSEKFYPLIEAAVNSALKNTTLQPHLIYDGEENDFTKKLKEKGVKIIRHRVSFYEALKNHYDTNALNIASGAFLRCDIPIIEQDDDFVLYTDCDVLFLKDFTEKIKPKYFACSAQNDKRNFRDFNTGVMVMNIKKLKESHEKFVDFISKNMHLFNAFDQTAYQIFYSGKNSKLPLIYNHKPHWGIDEKAVILHFHGAKPINFTTEDLIKNLPYDYFKLYKKSPEAYDFYLDLFNKYYKIEYSRIGIEKLKSGEFIMPQKPKTLEERLKSKLLKLIKTIQQRFKLGD